MVQLLALPRPQPVSSSNVRPKRLAWLEGIRIIAAVMILLYHAQLYFSDYDFTPQPTGLVSNLQQLWVSSSHADIPIFFQLITIPFWFGFQFLDVFILVSGFSLVLSLSRQQVEHQPLDSGQFLKRRLLRLLFPFWTVAWFSYPILWGVGALTHTYHPDAWHSFAGLTFPLTLDYRGTLLLSTSGPWWFIPLVISFTLVSPLLWSLWQRWGIRNLLLCSLVITISYRILAIYLLHGHPTYVIWNTAAGEAPFQLFLAKLSTFVVGMAIAVAYQHGQGPLFWSQPRALIIGSLIYLAGFVAQFYQPGWIFTDLLLPPGLALLAMVITRKISSIPYLRSGLVPLGACSYSYFLIHNFVVDRTLNLIVQGNPLRYFLLLPVMVVLTLILAIGIELIQPTCRKLVLSLWNLVDSFFCNNRQTNQQYFVKQK